MFLLVATSPVLHSFSFMLLPCCCGQGRYYIKMPGLGISHSFTVSEDALRPALGALSRTVYAQRCGVALSKEYLAPWERPEVRQQGFVSGL